MGTPKVTPEEKFRILDAFARVLVRRHLGPTWRVRWGNAKKEYGSCDWDARVIRLSRYLAMRGTVSSFRDTTMHEIAHALAPRLGHGKEWKAACKHLKCNPRAVKSSLRVK